MPQTLDQHSSTNVVRLLNVGDSGAGKTGQLASLARAGYNLWILDYDNGLDILANVLRQSDPEALKRVHYETIRDKITTIAGKPKVKSPPTAFDRAGKLLTEWKADEFTHKDIIVLDTLNTFSKAALNAALFAGARLNQNPQLQDYGWLATGVLMFLEMLTAEDMHCNLIVNSHIKYFEGNEDLSLAPRGLPAAKGKQISQDIGIFFNTVVHSRTIGTGSAAKRILSTKPQGVIELKTSNPSGVKDQYPVDTGLAQLFQDILGSNPLDKPGTPSNA